MADRTCIVGDCETLLSRYNDSDRCGVHRSYQEPVTEDIGALMRGIEPWHAPAIPQPPKWAHRAACAWQIKADQWLEEMFSEETSAHELLGPVIAMKVMCLDCPVRRPCLEWALDKEDAEYREGIFGGLTPRERGQVNRDPDPITAGLQMLDDQHRTGLVVRALPLKPYRPPVLDEGVSMSL